MASTNHDTTHDTPAPNTCLRGKIFAFTVPAAQLPDIMLAGYRLWNGDWSHGSRNQLLVFACDNTRNANGEHAAPAEPVGLVIISHGSSRDKFTLLHVKVDDEDVFGRHAQQCVNDYSLQQVSTELWWDLRSPIWDEALATVSALEYARAWNGQGQRLVRYFTDTLLPSMLDAARSLPSVMRDRRQNDVNHT